MITGVQNISEYKKKEDIKDVGKYTESTKAMLCGYNTKEYIHMFRNKRKDVPITLDFDGIQVTLTGNQLINLPIEDFRNTVGQYPQNVIRSLKEMRTKLKNQVGDKSSNT